MLELLLILKSLFDYICACDLDFRILKLLVLQSFYLIIHVSAAYILEFWNYWFHKEISCEYICACGLDIAVIIVSKKFI